MIHFSDTKLSSADTQLKTVTSDTYCVAEKYRWAKNVNQIIRSQSA